MRTEPVGYGIGPGATGGTTGAVDGAGVRVVNGGAVGVDPCIDPASVGVMIGAGASIGNGSMTVIGATGSGSGSGATGSGAGNGAVCTGHSRHGSPASSPPCEGGSPVGCEVTPEEGRGMEGAKGVATSPPVPALSTVSTIAVSDASSALAGRGDTKGKRVRIPKSP